MNVSLFVEYLTQLFPSLKNIIEKYNGKRQKDEYLFKSMLRKEYSVDLKWESTSVNASIVAADVVALDSELPLKKRDRLEGAHGTIPKLGMKVALGEKQISDLNIMKAKGEAAARIVAILTNDAIKCANGVDERLEEIFLTGLSEGIALIPDSDTVGVGVRLDYGYKDENKFTPTINWGAANYTPISDIERVLAAARSKGNIIRNIILDQRAYNLIRMSAEGRTLGANYLGHSFAPTTGSPAATPTNFNSAFKDEYNVEFVIVEKVVRVEKDGKETNVTPWSTDKVVFVPSLEVGRLVYGTLAEETNPVAGVYYSKVNEYTLISKYSKNDPLREFTSSQAIAVPVIDNVDQIYQLEIDAALTDSQSEGDATVSLFGYDYTKTEVITAMGQIGRAVPNDITDADLLAAVNALSNYKKAELKTKVYPFPKLSATSLDFAKTADSTGKTVDVSVINSATVTVSVPSSASWCTATVANNVVTVKVSANSDAERSTEVSVTANSKTSKITVTQASGL